MFICSVRYNAAGFSMRLPTSAMTFEALISGVVSDHLCHLLSVAQNTKVLLPCSMQQLGGLGDSDAQQQATIESTLRMKEISLEEATIQGSIVIGLRFTTWEPVQAVRLPCHISTALVA